MMRSREGGAEIVLDPRQEFSHPHRVNDFARDMTPRRTPGTHDVVPNKCPPANHGIERTILTAVHL